LADLTGLVRQALMADLPDAVPDLLARLRDRAAVTTDTSHLMDALPPLADVFRYGSVRRIDAAMVRPVVDGVVARVAIGLPAAVASLDDDAAGAMVRRLVAVDRAVAVLRDDEHRVTWQATLAGVAEQRGLHG